MAEKLGQPPQVLSSCCQEHFVSDAAQVPQPEPVEPENALHVRKSHLDLLALTAGLLEGFRIGQARTRSRTSSLRSRVILRAVAVVHFGFSEHCEQSLLLAL
jgi:hypothetical protein